MATEPTSSSVSKLRIEIDRYDVEDNQRPIGMTTTDRFIPITQSELGQWQCPRRGHFRDTGLRGRSTRVQSLGSYWHLISEDMYNWWKVHDQPYPDRNLMNCGWCKGAGWSGEGRSSVMCGYCAGTGLGPVKKIQKILAELADHAQEGRGLGADEADEMAEKLARMADGYMQRWHGDLLQNIEIVGVEYTLARPITNPVTGAALAPVTVLQRVPGGPGTFAMPGALQNPDLQTKQVRWPYVFMGRGDAIGRDRRSRAGWFIDTKSSIHPGGFAERLLMDPQLPLYCWAASDPRTLEELGISEVRGYMYDVTSTANQNDPKRLKWVPPKLQELRDLATSKGIEVKGRKINDYLAALGIQRQTYGLFSTSETPNASVPSWRYERALMRLGVNVAPYEQFLDHLYATVDQRLYQRPYTTFGQVDMARAGAELYGRARMIASFRRAAVTAPDPMRLNMEVPRVPVCMAAGAGCAYTPVCLQDDALSRADLYDVRPTVQWWEQEA